MKLRIPAVLLALLMVTGCASVPPSQTNDVCVIFDEKGGLLNNWYRYASRAEREFGVPVPIIMATIWQESRFVAKARPPRERLLGLIPWRRPSSAFGYSQAKTETWRWYKENTGKRRARRSSFKHASHFVGWYHAQSHRMNGIALNDAYNLYLAYHEGHGGFRRGTYRNKAWLMDVARRVERQSQVYQQQLASCRRRR